MFKCNFKFLINIEYIWKHFQKRGNKENRGIERCLKFFSNFKQGFDCKKGEGVPKWGWMDLKIDLFGKIDHNYLWRSAFLLGLYVSYIINSTFYTTFAISLSSRTLFIRFCVNCSSLLLSFYGQFVLVSICQKLHIWNKSIFISCI